MRSFKAALVTMALALAIPAAALAHHATHHSASSHARHHKHHAHLVRFVAGTAHKTTTATHSTATTVTTTTTTETPGESVGTVLSFEGGVLKITLGDGSVVGGKVTENTRLECASAAQGQEGSDDDGDQNDQGDDQNEHGGQPPVSGGHDQQGPGSSHGDDQHGSLSEVMQPECTVAALVAGAKVEEAELTLTSAGAVWEKVSLTK